MIDAVILMLLQLAGTPIWVAPAAAAQLGRRIRAAVLQGATDG